MDKFDRGELQSGQSTILQNGAFFQDGSLILSSAAKAEFGNNPHPKGRRLAISGERTYLAVRIIGADRATTASASVISDKWFGSNGDAVNYKSQIEACSYDQVTVKPYSNSGITNGVVTVTIPNTISGENNEVIRDAAENAVNKLNLSGDIDHTMLCIPPDTKEGWIGYAYFNWDLSVYNDNWCLYPSIQMHGEFVEKKSINAKIELARSKRAREVESRKIMTYAEAARKFTDNTMSDIKDHLIKFN